MLHAPIGRLHPSDGPPASTWPTPPPGFHPPPHPLATFRFAHGAGGTALRAIWDPAPEVEPDPPPDNTPGAGAAVRTPAPPRRGRSQLLWLPAISGLVVGCVFLGGYLASLGGSMPDAALPGDIAQAVPNLESGPGTAGGPPSTAYPSPTAQAAALPTATPLPPAAPLGSRSILVLEGQSFAYVADYLGLTGEQLAQKLGRRAMFAGETITVPVYADPAPPVGSTPDAGDRNKVDATTRTTGWTAPPFVHDEAPVPAGSHPTTEEGAGWTGCSQLLAFKPGHAPCK